MFTKERKSLSELFHRPELEAKTLQVSAGQSVDKTQDFFEQPVYLILAGQVRLSQPGPDHQSRLVDILGPDDWFGACALAGHKQSCVEATAATDSQLLVVSAQRLLVALPNYPEALELLIQHLVFKLQGVCQTAGALVFDDCNRRLIKTLLRFSQGAAATVHDDGVVLRITHQQLAQAVGVARETISVALTQLRRKHVLRTGRNQLIFDPQTLRHMLEQPSTNHPTAHHTAQAQYA